MTEVQFNVLTLSEDSEAFQVPLQMASAPFWNIRAKIEAREYVAVLRKSLDSDPNVVS